MEPEQVIEVEKLSAEIGSTIEVTDVLMLSDEGNLVTGQPLVEGARVMAEVLDHGRGNKVIIFKYKNKTRYRRKRGHRQGFTRLAIRSIMTGGEAPAASEETKPARRPRARAAAGPATATAPAAPRRAARKTESEG